MAWGKRAAPEPEQEEEVTPADDRLMQHLQYHLGPAGARWQEPGSERLPVDVTVFPPTEARPFAVLVTSGMSARPMTVPFGVARRAEREHAELCMLLPAAWPLASVPAHAGPAESAYWPIRLLRELARLPHETGSWLGAGHAIPHGAPYVQGLPFSAAVLVRPTRLGATETVPGEPPISLLQVLPLTEAELALKTTEGVQGLLRTLDPRRIAP
ncbi:MAG TPA: suppressor of fused domain protein [Pseudolysinimonas sp.]|nr:suppressor of fused domain protein [Pseudolysinimonas sp.]